MNLWHQLTAPSALITDDEERIRARFLIVQALVGGILHVMVLAILVLQYGWEPVSLIILVDLFFVMIAYGLGRTRHYRKGIALGTLSATVWAYAIILTEPTAHTAMIVMIPIFVISFFWPLRFVIPYALVVIFGAILLTYQTPDTWDSWLFTTLFLATNSVLIIAGTYTRSQMQQSIMRQNHALYVSEARFRMLAAHANDVIWTLDLDGYFTYVSPSVERLRGYSPEEVLGQHFSAALTPESLEVIRPSLDEIRWKVAAGIRDTYRRRFELEQPCKDGSTVWTEVESGVMYDDDGNFAGILGVTRDIMARRQVEKNRLELAVERERVAILQRFIGDLSHDLLTPISILRTSMYLLGKPLPPEKQRERIHGIEVQVERLETMIKDLLMMSRLDKMVMSEFDFQAGDLNLLVGEIVAEYQQHANKNLQILEFKRYGPIPPVTFDRDNLAHALSNLIDNALKYTQKGGKISVTTSVDGEQVMIDVHDTGAGIPPDDIPLIFDRFYRGDRHRPSEGGTGLGLAIVKKIIELHDGSIEVTSEPGKGSLFHITLPLSAELANQTA